MIDNFSYMFHRFIPKQKLPILISLAIILIFSLYFSLILNSYKTKNGIVSIADFQTPFNTLVDKSGNDKYLFYLPHSGFVNQLIELSNALLIAYISNRTLILPPLYIGFLEMPFEGFEKQVESLGVVETVVGGYCANVKAGVDMVTPITSPNWKIAKIKESKGKRFIISFDTLFSRDKLPVRVISIEEFLEKQSILSGLNDVTVLKEKSRFGFRFYEGPNNGNGGLVDNLWNIYDESELDHINSGNAGKVLQVDPNGDTFITKDETSEGSVSSDTSSFEFGRFKHLVNINSFKNLTPLLILTSTFLEDRVLLKSRPSILVQSGIERSLIFSNATLINIVDKIIDKVGGNYVGIHIRGYDGQFKNDLLRTIKRAGEMVVENLCANSLEERCIESISKDVNSTGVRLYVATDVDTEFVRRLLLDVLPKGSEVYMLNDFEEFMADLDELSGELLVDGKGLCLRVLDKYLGSDAKETDEDISQGIDEIEDNVDSIKHSSTSGKKQKMIKCENNSYETGNLRRLWFPFIDMMVAAKGLSFMGTKGSSFSRRIAIFHKVYSNDPWVMKSA